LLALIKAISRQLVRRELKLDSSHIISIIREGLAALPVASVDIQVRLHPLDAEVVRELLQPDDDVRPWTILTDPLMEQGGCRIMTNSAQIDSRLDTRLGRVIATMLEDERAARE
jgi:flagellar assembly protein FliH